MALAVLPFVVAVVGALVYGFGGRGAELGRLAFAVGMIWLIYSMISSTLRFGSAAIAVWPFVMAVVGALVYAFAKDNDKVRELARITFFAGLLWLVYSVLGHTVKFG